MRNHTSLYSIVLPYVLLLSFSSAQINVTKLSMINMMNQSPYDGVAVQLVGPYETKDITYQNFASGIALIKQSCKKQIWPWVFFNRFIGYKPGERSLSLKANNPYFQKIKGIDIFNTTGALEDFYQIWRLALRIAKETGSPGIFIDPEAYNNYKTYRLKFLAEEMGRPIEEIELQLESVGKKLADIANEIYPQATLWFSHGFPEVKGSGKNISTTLIIRGLAERIKTTNSQLKLVISAGGGCYTSLADLDSVVDREREAFKETIANYPSIRLGGIISPWHDASLKTGFYAKGKCGQCPFTSIEEFKPVITRLVRSFDYVYIYAAGALGFYPYKPEVAEKYNRVIGDAVAAGRKK